MKAILFAFCMILCTGVYAQQTQVVPFVQTGGEATSFSPELFSEKNSFSFQQASQTRLYPPTKVNRIPSSDYLPGLFCKLEYQLESKSKLAPRFRLGSLYYTEWMEGKRDYFMRYYK